MSQSIWTGYAEFVQDGSANAITTSIDMPHRGVIQAIDVIRSTDDAALDADFNRLELHAGAAASPATLILDLKAEWANRDELSVSYLNVDGSPALPQRKLYVVAAGTRADTYTIKITIRLFV